MATTTFSTNGSGTSSYYALDVVVSGIATGTTTAITFEVDFSATSHEDTGCDVSDSNFNFYGLWADYDLSGSGSTTYTHNVSSLPPSPNSTYTFEVYDNSGSAGLAVTQVRVIVTHTGSSGSNYNADGSDVQSASEAQSTTIQSQRFGLSPSDNDSASQSEGVNATVGSGPTNYILEVGSASSATLVESPNVALFSFSQFCASTSPDITLYAWYSATLDQDVSAGVADLSGNQRDLVITGTLPVVSSAGKNGSHAYDDDTSVEAEYDIGGYYAGHSQSAIGGFTVAGWINFSSSATDTYAFGLRRYGDSSKASWNSMVVGFVRLEDAEGNPEFRVSVAKKSSSLGTLNSLHNAGAMYPDTWHHIALAGEGFQYLFLDGEYVGGPSFGLWSYSATQVDALWLGAHGECLIDDVQFYESSLNEQSVELLSRARAYGATPISLAVDSVGCASECSSVSAIPNQIAFPQNVESPTRVHADAPCVHQNIGLAYEGGGGFKQELFWYLPEANDPNGYDQVNVFYLNDLAGGSPQGTINEGLGWGTWGWKHPQLSKYSGNGVRWLGFNMFGTDVGVQKQTYVNTRKKLFDNLSGDISLWVKLLVPDNPNHTSGMSWQVMGTNNPYGNGWFLQILPNLNVRFGISFTRDYVSPYNGTTTKVKDTIVGASAGIITKDTIANIGVVVKKSTAEIVFYVDGQENTVEKFYNVFGNDLAQALAEFNDPTSRTSTTNDVHLGKWEGFNQFNSYDNQERYNFDGLLLDVRGYNHALTTAEMVALETSFKGVQASCNATDPDLAEELAPPQNLQAAFEVSELELQPLEILVDSVERPIVVDAFYVLPIPVVPANVDSSSEASSVEGSGYVLLEPDSADSYSIANLVFTLDRRSSLDLHSSESASQSQSVELPQTRKELFVNSANALAEAESPYVPQNAGQKLVVARSVQSPSESSVLAVTEPGKSDAYLIYCPSRSYDYANGPALPDLSETHSTTSRSNSDIEWIKVDDEWCIYMANTDRQTGADYLTNAVEIVPDASEDINSFGSLAAVPDEPFSISMHFQFNSWPIPPNSSGRNTAMGLFSFVALPKFASYNSTSQSDDYWGTNNYTLHPSVNIFIVRNPYTQKRSIQCVLRSPDGSFYHRMYSNTLSTTFLASHTMHHIAVTYDGNHGINLYLNGQNLNTSSSLFMDSPQPRDPLTSSISEFDYPNAKRRAFIGRSHGHLQAATSVGTQHSKDQRGEAVPFWDDFRFFREELTVPQINRLAARGVDLPARYTLSIPQVVLPSECLSMFAPVSFEATQQSVDSSSETERLLTIGSNFEANPEDARSFTRVSSFPIIRHKGVVGQSVDSVSETSDLSVLAIRGLSVTDVSSSTEASSPSIALTIVASLQNIHAESEVSDASLSGDSAVSVENVQTQALSESPDAARGLRLAPHSVESQAASKSVSVSVTVGLVATGSASNTETDSFNLSGHLVLNPKSIKSESAVSSVFFFSEKTLSVPSSASQAECEAFVANIRTSLSQPQSISSSSESEAFSLVAASSLEISSCDSISVVSDVSLTFIAHLDVLDIDLASESNSVYASMSPLRAASLACASEVKGFTLPDLSSKKKGPPRLFLESDLIIGDY
jgi:hypothetical protein